MALLAAPWGFCAPDLSQGLLLPAPLSVFLLCSLPHSLSTETPRPFLHLSFRVSLTALPQEGAGMGYEGAGLILGRPLYNEIGKRLHV